MNMKLEIFKDLPVWAGNSQRSDGMMKIGEAEPENVIYNRRKWLGSVGTSIENATLLSVEYKNGITYDRLLDVGATELGKGMYGEDDIAVSDALFTKTRGQALFLPLADCGGVVMFDAKENVLGLLHLGRHSTLDGLAEKSVRHMEKTYNSNPEDMYIWTTPAISGESYWLKKFDFAKEQAWQPHIKEHGGGYFVDLQGYNFDQFVSAGVPKNQIERSPINTASDSEYPSHYAHQTLGHPQKAGRFAVATYLEPVPE